MSDTKSLLIVGAFPPKDTNIYGGVITDCRSLMDSNFPEYFNLILLDSTQMTNPPPNIFIRSVFSFFRFILYIRLLILRRPDGVLLFTSAGASVLEKGVMGRLAKLLNIPVFFFPRGGAIIEYSNHSILHKAYVRIALSGATLFLCQGPKWQRFATEILGYTTSSSPIIYNWVASEELIRIGKTKSYEKNKIPTLIFLGWLEKENGIFELLEACYYLSKKILNLI